MQKYLVAFLAIFAIGSAVSCSCGDDDDSSTSPEPDDDSDDDDDTDDDTAVDDDGDDDMIDRPNIVVIMADDLDEKLLDVLIDGGHMPNLKEKIIDAGIDFRESYVTNPLCCPSRATFLTGQYTHNNNVRTNNFPFGGVTRLDDTSTVATWLQDAGYTTGLVGKYLNGYGTETEDDYIPPGWSDWQALTSSTVYSVYGNTVNDNGELVAYGEGEDDYQTDILAVRSMEFIEDASPDDPFFLWVTPLAPHVEFPEDWLDQQPTYSAWYELSIRPAPRHEGVLDLDLPDEPSFNEADISDKPPYLADRPHLTEDDIENARAQYNGMAASMLALDVLIGDVYDALVARGALDDTLLIFTSDNGYLLGRHLIPQKNAPYEESIRIPLYMRVPGIGKASIDAMVANNDLAPTFADLAGAEPTIPVDGRSLAPLIEDPDRNDWRRRLLFEHWSATGTTIEVPTFAAVRSGAGAPEGAGFIQVEYRSFFGVPTDSEFYEIAVDPFQLDSAHEDAQYESVRGTLSEFVAALKDCVGDECRLWEDAESPPDK